MVCESLEALVACEVVKLRFYIWAGVFVEVRHECEAITGSGYCFPASVFCVFVVVERGRASVYVPFTSKVYVTVSMFHISNVVTPEGTI